MVTVSPAGRVRMVDVARRAGVGTITVSRALRTPERVSPEVRARVTAAMQATGYVPNLAAGTLKSQRSRVVAAIVPTLRNTIFAETVDGLAVMGLEAKSSTPAELAALLKADTEKWGPIVKSIGFTAES